MNNRRVWECTVSGIGGFAMLEVLVTMLVLLVGLLGLAGLQTRMVLVNRDAMQRAQALWLLQDMAGRIKSNRDQATSYVTASSHLGVGSSTSTDCTGLAGYQLDLCQWNQLLQGASETLDDESATKVGAMEGARGCIYSLGTDPQALRVVVVWQGVNASGDPLGSFASTAGGGCGSGLFGGDDYRRAVFLDVIIPTLS